ncbi:MAG: hypothetical protein CMO80_17205 [Verrucomicrobiales bacterium]|nr:hypothetical protein [Verrucomicrobiales bacterium]
MNYLKHFLLSVTAIILFSGCAGAERKLGRGINNVMEITRMGEFSRSIEQTGLWDGPEQALTTGVIRGFNRTAARMAIGFSEILTFPIPTPNYDPYFFPEKWFQDPFRKTPTDPFREDLNFPDNYRPRKLHDAIFATDTMVGFAGGEIVPWIPGSRFRVFER